MAHHNARTGFSAIRGLRGQCEIVLRTSKDILFFGLAGHLRTSRSVRNSASYIQGHPIFRACWADHVPLAPNFTYRWAMTARSRRSRLHGGALVGVAVPEQSWISKLHCSETASQATPQRRRRRANTTGGKDNATAYKRSDGWVKVCTWYLANP